MSVYFNIPDELIIDMYTSMFSTDISVECCKTIYKRYKLYSTKFKIQNILRINI